MTNVVIITCTFILSMAFITFYVAKRRPNSFRSSIFFMLMTNIAMTALCSLIGNWLEHSVVVTGAYYVLQSMAEHSYFILHGFLSPLYCLYVMSVSRSSIALKGKKLVVFLTPLVIAELLIVSNPLTGWIFYFDESLMFCRGDFEFLIYIEAVIYLVVSVIEMIRCHRMIGKRNIFLIWYFFAFIIIGVVIQLLFENLKVELFAEAIAMIGIMFTVECEEGLLDATSRAYNRRAFFSESEKLIECDYEFAVISINMLNFKLYKRMFGYADMMNVVYMIVDWLQKLDKYITVYRVTSTHIAIICSYGDLKYVKNLEQKIVDKFEEKFVYKGKPIDFNVNIGTIMVPGDYNSAEVLLNIVEDNVFNDTVGVRVVKPEHYGHIVRRDDVESALKNAISNDLFEVYFQPIWGVEEKRFVSAEALVRLNDPKLGFISPEEFIAVAERTGMITKIGRVVFEKVCSYMSQESMKALNLKTVEINLSLYQLIGKNIGSDFKTILDKYGIDAGQINLEITESKSYGDINKHKKTIQRLMDSGFTFSLDDYGTGYSNLSFVASMDFVNIKSDKSLLWDSENNESARLILEDTIRLIRRLGKNVIQEGVETRKQYDFSVNSGVNYIQGYYFSKPLPYEEFIAFVRGYSEKE